MVVVDDVSIRIEASDRSLSGDLRDVLGIDRDMARALPAENMDRRDDEEEGGGI